MSAVDVAQDLCAARGVSAEQLPEADPQLLPLDEEAEAERERRVQESYGEVSQGVVDNTPQTPLRDMGLGQILRHVGQAEIRKRRIEGIWSSRWRWHLDEMFLKINGEMHYLWRAVDHEGEVLEASSRRRETRKRR